MFERFTGAARRVIVLARNEADPQTITSAHLLVACALESNSPPAAVLAAHGATPERLREMANMVVPPVREVTGDKASAQFSADARAVLDAAVAAAAAEPVERIDVRHLVVAMCSPTSGYAYAVLSAAGVSPADVADELSPQPPDPVGAAAGRTSRPPLFSRRSGQARTSAIETYGVDLTAAASEGNLDVVVGRADEIARVIQVLCRRSKNNPVLIGEPGVGKTAVVEGLAQRIADGDVPEPLAGKHVLSLDLGSMIAGTKLRGDFEQRVRAVVTEATERDDVIVFLDEIHTLASTGGTGDASSAAEMLKPALARGDFAVIGATTTTEWRIIEAQAALSRRFSPITVDEPDHDTTVRILAGLRPGLAEHHGTEFADDALVAAARFARRYLTERRLPDSAVDLVDEAGAAAALSRMRGTPVEMVTAEMIADVLTATCGVPVGALDATSAQRLGAAEEILSQRVVGQHAALAAVASAVRRSRVGLSDPRRPDGSFIFLGPSGVGKTETARALAEFLFGDEAAMITFDMSEYMESHSVSRLIGAPPGYVGHDEGGLLTEAVRRRPHSVVLFDEIEKAHPRVFDVLLQVLEEGRLTDSSGRVVDLSNTVVIMTSNLGAGTGAQRRVGFSSSSAADAASVRTAAAMKALEGHFRPEFLNRVDHVVVFDPLGPDELLQIVSAMLDEFAARVAARGVTLSVTHEAKVHLAALGADPTLGARPLRRAVASQVADRVAEALLDAGTADGAVVLVDVLEGDVVVSVSASSPADPLVFAAAVEA